MKFNSLLEKSIRAKLFVSLAAMLLPLFVLAGSTFYTFGLLASSFHEVVEESVQEMIPVAELQVRIQNCRIVLYHLVHEGSSEDRILFATLSREVGRTFAGLPPFGSAGEREQLELALEAWKSAEESSRKIMATDDPAADPASHKALNRFNADLDRVLLHLEGVRRVASEDITAGLNQVSVVGERIRLLNSAAFIIGAAMVLGIGLLLLRSILRPVRLLTDGAKRLAAGDLSHRLPFGREDELGDLTEAFNAMAEELEKDRKVLRELSVRDPLTGLYNHREFFRLLRDEMERSSRYFHPISLLMLDLDHFKKINDTYGHPIGDRVLCSVANSIRRELRQVDHVARYGGEEFAVILPETAEDRALVIANRIRQAVAARPVAVSGTEGVSLTISIGLAVFPDNAAVEENLVRLADQALYLAKESGRNRVCLSSQATLRESGAAPSFEPF